MTVALRMAAKPKSNLRTRSEAESGFSHFIDCAISAAVNAFVIVLLGQIALGIVSGVVGRMIPSALPGFEGGAGYVSKPGVWWNALFSLRFKIIYAAVFLVCLRQKLASASPVPSTNGREPRWQRIGQQFAENWFGSLIGNAFLAMGLAMALAHIPDFSFWKWAWRWFVSVTPTPAWLDDGPLTWLNPWLGWYDQNKVKFNFWLIYFAAVCDDFGIPNFKTLARWLWRRWKKRTALPATVPVAESRPEKV
jgi:hypothetical protein